MERILCASVVLGLFLIGSLEGQEPPVTEPVPPELLREGELVVPAHNFAITTPAGNWRWFFRTQQAEGRSQETYICREADSGGEFQVISTGMRSVMDDRFIAGYKGGVQESLTAGGLKVVSLEMTDSNKPQPDSYRCRWEAAFSDGRPVYGYAYLTALNTVFTIQHITSDATEPPVFTQFAGSFHVLNATVRPMAPAPWLVVYLILLGIACIIAAIVNRVCRRPVLNGGTLGGVLVIVVAVLRMAMGEYAGVSRGLAPEKLGEITGRRLGEAFIAVFIAILVSLAYQRHRRKTRPTLVPEGRDDEPSGATSGR